MDYAATLRYLYEQLPMFQRVGAAAYKKDLGNTQALLEALGNPHKNFRSIHIAGTNGKGSVSSILYSVLCEQGYCCGLYTSPHLSSFTERVRVDSDYIGESEVVAFVDQYRHLIEEIKPSFFELTVAMSFWYFRERGVEIAVVETGMGGRLDSTNVLDPILSVITNIGMDHTEHLGDTLALIAGEKAGIIKEKVPVVIGEFHPETWPVFEEKAASLNASIHLASEQYSLEMMHRDLEGQAFRVFRWGQLQFDEMQLGLAGAYQHLNLRTTLCALDLLQASLNIKEECIIKGVSQVVKNSGLRGRMSVLQREPTVICDIAHNKVGISQVLEQIERLNYPLVHFVWGMVREKELAPILNLLPEDAKYYFVSPDVPRGLEVDALVNAAHQAGLKGKAWPSVQAGFEAALASSNPEDLIYIGGSTFVVAEVI